MLRHYPVVDVLCVTAGALITSGIRREASTAWTEFVKVYNQK